jgi:hypothetical protein
VWTVRGDAGMFSRVGEAEVEIVEETPRVRFTITGLSGADDLTVQAMSAASWLMVVPPSVVPPELATWELGGAARWHP